MNPLKITGLTREQWQEARTLYHKQYGCYPDGPTVGDWGALLEAKYLYEESAAQAIEDAIENSANPCGEIPMFPDKEERRRQSDAAIEQMRKQQAEYERERATEVDAIADAAEEARLRREAEEEALVFKETIFDEDFDFGF